MAPTPLGRRGRPCSLAVVFGVLRNTRDELDVWELVGAKGYTGGQKEEKKEDILRVGC